MSMVIRRLAPGRLAWLALAGLAMVAAALAVAAWIAVPAGTWAGAPDRLVRACLLASESAVRGVWGWASSHPWTAATLGVLAGSLAWALFRLGASLVGGWRMKGRLAAYEPGRFPVLHRAIRGAPEVDPASIRVVRIAKPAAFTAGLIRPRICISVGLLETLTEGELRSVLRHEQAHAAAWDPMRLAAVRFLSDFLWFLPVAGSLADAFSNQAELRADEAAVGAGSDSIALAAAIVKTAKGALVAPRLAPALSGLALVEQRVTRLLGRDRSVEATIPWGRAAASGVLVIGVLALLLGPAVSSGAAPSPDPVWVTMSEGMMDCPGHHGMAVMPPADRCRYHG